MCLSVEIPGDIPAAHAQCGAFFRVYSLASLGVGPSPGVSYDRFRHTGPVAVRANYKLWTAVVVTIDVVSCLTEQVFF